MSFLGFLGSIFASFYPRNLKKYTFEKRFNPRKKKISKFEKKSMNKTVGERIRKFRKEKLLQQNEVAELLNISKSAYQRMESGKSSSWANHLPKLCEIFEKEPQELLQPTEKLIQINNEPTNGIGIQHGDIHTQNKYILDKLIEQYESRIQELKEEIEILKNK